MTYSHTKLSSFLLLLGTTALACDKPPKAKPEARKPTSEAPPKETKKEEPAAQKQAPKRGAKLVPFKGGKFTYGPWNPCSTAALAPGDFRSVEWCQEDRKRQGLPAGRPAKEIEVAPFAIDETEISWAMYDECVKDRACEAVPKSDWECQQQGKCSKQTFEPWMKEEAPPIFPISRISFEEAERYCEWAGKRLPTAEEWEFAARAGGHRLLPWDEKLSPKEALPFQKQEVSLRGRKGVDAPPEHDGVRGMLGNVQEITGSTSILKGKNVCEVRGEETSRIASPANGFTRYRVLDVDGRHPQIGFRCAKSR